MQQLKDALTQDMQDFLQESKWENHIKESVSEILEYKPEKPLVHLYEKFQIKQKLDSQNKLSNFISDLSFYATKIDPSIYTIQQCQIKLLSIIVDKYQQNKIKKFDGLKCSFIILQEIPNNKEIKDYFLKKIQSQYEDILTVNKLSELILKTIVIYRIISELILIQDILDMKGQVLSTQSLFLFMNETSDQQTIFKKFEIQQIVEKLPQEPKVNLYSLMKAIVEQIINLDFD
ncbi:hypothetical protein ABPG74_002171 [Tetrahymena malaccensis]